MRTTILIAVTALSLVGCRTKPLDHPISDDFGTTNNAHDMAMSKIDMSVSPGGTCQDLLNCLNGCGSQQCQNQCFNDASPDAQDVLTQALNCVYGFCQMKDGNRPPRCDDNFNDFSDGGAGECNNCLTNAFASLGGYDCMPKNSPDCNPASCQMLVMACMQQ